MASWCPLYDGSTPRSEKPAMFEKYTPSSEETATFHGLPLTRELLGGHSPYPEQPAPVYGSSLHSEGSAMLNGYTSGLEEPATPNGFSPSSEKPASINGLPRSPMWQAIVRGHTSGSEKPAMLDKYALSSEEPALFGGLPRNAMWDGFTLTPEAAALFKTRNPFVEQPPVDGRTPHPEQPAMSCGYSPRTVEPDMLNKHASHHEQDLPSCVKSYLDAEIVKLNSTIQYSFAGLRHENEAYLRSNIESATNQLSTVIHSWRKEAHNTLGYMRDQEKSSAEYLKQKCWDFSAEMERRLLDHLSEIKEYGANEVAEEMKTKLRSVADDWLAAEKKSFQSAVKAVEDKVEVLDKAVDRTWKLAQGDLDGMSQRVCTVKEDAEKVQGELRANIRDLQKEFQEAQTSLGHLQRKIQAMQEQSAIMSVPGSTTTSLPQELKPETTKRAASSRSSLARQGVDGKKRKSRYAADFETLYPHPRSTNFPWQHPSQLSASTNGQVSAEPPFDPYSPQ